MILIVIGLVAIIFYIKFVMVVQSDNASLNSAGGIVASIANAVQIQVRLLFFHSYYIVISTKNSYFLFL